MSAGVDATFFQGLEPILGGGLALNLAYLYLKWFHYLEEIGKTAVAARSAGADSNEILEQSSGDYDVKCVNYLASLGKAGKTRRRKQNQFPKLPWGKWWSYFLLVFFVTRLDRGVAIIGTALIMLFLIMGVAHDVDMYQNSLTNLEEKTKHKFFHLATLAFIWPVVMASLAFFIRRSVENYVKSTVGDVAINKQETLPGSLDDAPQPKT